MVFFLFLQMALRLCRGALSLSLPLPPRPSLRLLRLAFAPSLHLPAAPLQILVKTCTAHLWDKISWSHGLTGDRTHDEEGEEEEGLTKEEGVWRVSTFKRRRTKMNRHKLKKRRKKLRLNTKISRS